MAERMEDKEIDVFDTILFTEESTIQRGQTEGKTDGERVATLNSLSEGLKEGGDLASEIGFYSGICQGLLDNKTQLGDAYTDKTWSRVIKLSNRILQFEDQVSDEAIGLEEMVILIRDEFKAVVSKFKLQIKFKKPELNEL